MLGRAVAAKLERVGFVLASASPRRRWLLEAAGLKPQVIATSVDEEPRALEPPIAYALRVAEEKALAIGPEQGLPVLAADTVVALDGDILRKTADEDGARRTLARLSGRVHTVHTAVALYLPGPPHRLMSRVVSTEVWFRTLRSDEIERYVSTGEPMDKAGAYGIQGDGAVLVARVEGSYTNVIGLPLEETLELLNVAGVSRP